MLKYNRWNRSLPKGAQQQAAKRRASCISNSASAEATASRHDASLYQTPHMQKGEHGDLQAGCQCNLYAVVCMSMQTNAAFLVVVFCCFGCNALHMLWQQHNCAVTMRDGGPSDNRLATCNLRMETRLLLYSHPVGHVLFCFEREVLRE